MKRTALGKGIAALIPDLPASRHPGVLELPLQDIRPNPLQPRRHFSPEGLAELAASITEHGVLQPVIVSRAPEGGYHLVAGERRWRAAQLAGLERIPAVVRETSGGGEILALALIENLQRADLTPIEEARAFHHLRAEMGLSQEHIAQQVGKDRSTVANALRLLQLPLALQEMVDGGKLSAGHARTLLAVADPERQQALAERCLREGWSVRQLERAVQEPKAPQQREPDPDTLEASERLTLVLGTRVEIRRTRRGGEIRVRFANEAELIRLFRHLAGEDR
ncbi:MAG TPA: ParB/RepB/Spo0J family partition protein [Thermoanaerobaculaceae bacterium]|nr:ParB/RepB/Spo0J family partition protein [Thermoanaerobaculaceae bacterium]HRS17790.1 ParB/RepB/Spo0J family partition protein [Thermoanaerobaculaceae bacterium]